MRWFVEISPLGQAQEPGKRLCVEATQWQPALQKARTLNGEQGSLGTFSIELLDEGYRAIDPVSRLGYVVRRAPDDAELSEGGVAAQAPAAAGEAAAATDGAPEAQGSAPAKTRGRTTTLIYDAPVLNPVAAAAAPAMPAVLAALAAPTAPAPAASPAGGAPRPAPAGLSLPRYEVLSRREQAPTDQNPLVYREIVLVVPPGTPEDATAALLLDRVEEVRRSLEGMHSGKLIRLAAFDHRFQGRPERQPVVTLTWKDWRPEGPVLAYPLRGDRGDAPPDDTNAPEPAKASAAAETPAPAAAKAEPAVGLATATPAMDRPAPGNATATPPTARPAVGSASATPAEARPAVGNATATPAKADPRAPSAPWTLAEANPKATLPLGAAAKPNPQEPAAPSAVAKAIPEAPAAATAVAKENPTAAAPPAAAAPDDTKTTNPATPIAKANSKAPPPTAAAESAPFTAPAPAALPKTTPAAGTPAQAQPAAPASAPPSSSADAPARPSADDLLSELFEACVDMQFLGDALEGANLALAVALEKMPSEVGLVSFFDIDRREFVVVRQSGADRALLERLPERAPLAQEAMRSASAVVIADATRDSRARDERWAKAVVTPRSLVCAPVVADGRYLGILELANPLDGGPYTEAEGNALAYIGQQLAELLKEQGVVIDPDRVRAGARAGRR